jgi:hypothetical protein
LWVAPWFVMLPDLEQTNRHDRFLPLAIELVLAATRIVAIGLVAIGISGILAWGLGATAGKAFVAGDPPGVTYTAARCRDLLEYAPDTNSCAEAATTHHFDEVVWYRIAAGALGCATFLALALVRRRRERRELQPETFAPTVAAAVFGISGIWLIGQGIDKVILKTDGGGGGYLSGGVVAFAIAAWFTIPVIRSLTIRVPATA